ncbi:hypothetical protein C8R44DRAFT_977960 [Mycena epipterygia]|nr:hypothetical protein C8R44DRAFT_977960 [Mycena epipterygia]
MAVLRLGANDISSRTTTMALEMLPFYDCDDFGYEMLTTKAKRPIFRTADASYKHFCHCVLYDQVLEAYERHERSLADLPADLVISILEVAASSSLRTSRALALASSWISDAHSPGACLDTHNKGVWNHLEISSVPPPAWEARACPNLGALACQVAALGVFCDDADESFICRGVAVDVHSDCPSFHPISAEHHTLTFLLHKHRFDKVFPAAHLPCLTHFAMGFHTLPNWSLQHTQYSEQIRSFARSLDQHSLRLTMAVLVLRPSYFRPSPLSMRALAQAARDCNSRSNIMIYCLSDLHQELKFWDKCAGTGEDFWSLAQKQLALFSDINRDPNWTG